MVNNIHFGSEHKTQELWSTPDLPGPRFLDRPVYVLAGPETFSGAEELAYNLKHLGIATLVGERTRGGAHPTRIHKLDARFTVAVPFARSINPVTGTNWEGTGVIPHVETPADGARQIAHALAKEAAGKSK